MLFRSSAGQSNSSSLSASASSPSPLATINNHPMTTRSKVGVFKPKIFSVTTPSPSPPTTINEALSDPDWKQATLDEYNALLKFSTWDVVPLPSHRQPIGCMWIWKTKTNADGSLAKRKSRLVAKGFSQAAGIDYAETFSPVVKDRKSTRLNSSHSGESRMPSSA